MNDLLTDDEPTAARAFERASAHLWEGKLLKPFSGRRLIAAQACGLRFLKLAGQGGVDPLYDGILWDAVLTVYLCTSPDSECFRAVRQPERVIEAAMKWSEDQGVTSPDSPKFERLCTVFGEMMGEMMTSVTEPVAQPGAAPQKKMEDPQVSTGSSS